MPPADLINASLIWAGVATFIQVYQFRIPGINMVIGTGVLSVTGISFVFLNPIQAYIVTYIVSNAADAADADADAGHMLGTTQSPSCNQCPLLTTTTCLPCSPAA
jgi:xanthine/uracil permease